MAHSNYPVINPELRDPTLPKNFDGGQGTQVLRCRICPDPFKQRHAIQSNVLCRGYHPLLALR